MKSKAKSNETNVEAQINELEKELRTLRFQFSVTRSIENPKSFRNIRKKIARLYTIKNSGK